MLIIGLLVAGIFTGRDMIQAANIRSTVATKGEFDIGVMTFRSRFNGLPGDIRNPTGWGGAEPRAGTDRRGDGDGMVETGFATYAGSENFTNACGETLLFWDDLYSANMIKAGGNAAVDGLGPSCIPTTITTDTGLATYFPRSNISKDIFWFVYRDDPTRLRTHFYGLTQMDELTSNYGLMWDQAFYPIPVEVALQIDTKMDDGLPSTGKVQSRRFFYSGNAGYGDTNDTTYCRNGNLYKLSGGTGCSLIFEAPW